MLPNVLVGFMLGAGVAAWVYAKTMRSTGNNTKSSLTAAGIVGFLAFLAMVFALSAIFK